MTVLQIVRSVRIYLVARNSRGKITVCCPAYLGRATLVDTIPEKPFVARIRLRQFISREVPETRMKSTFEFFIGEHYESNLTGTTMQKMR
jgi:hypothetical protein